MSTPKRSCTSSRPRSCRVRGLTLAALLVLAAGCGGGGGGSPIAPPRYDPLVEEGWTSFMAGDFDGAVQSFDAAVAADETQAAAYTGLGWTRIRMGDPGAAATAFDNGALKAGTVEVLADLYAGWAFATGAMADPSGLATENFAASNTRAEAALLLDATWSLDYIPGVDRADLVVLEAENHFLLGEFALSLERVQALDAAFTADVATPLGRAALSTRIEQLAIQVTDGLPLVRRGVS